MAKRSPAVARECRPYHLRPKASVDDCAEKATSHYPLASVVLPLQTLSVASSKLTASSRPTAPPSGSAKCLRFGHWVTLCTLNMHVLTYLLTRDDYSTIHAVLTLKYGTALVGGGCRRLVCVDNCRTLQITSWFC